MGNKYAAGFFGTFRLVLGGCGSVAVGVPGAVAHRFIGGGVDKV